MQSLSSSSVDPQRLRSVTVLAAMLLALSACLFRAWMTDHPIVSIHAMDYCHPDEPIISHLTRRAVETGRISANWDGFAHQWWSRPTYQFSPYTIIHSTIAIGVHAVADWPVALEDHIRLARYLSAIWGGLAVLLLFFAARELFDEWVALLAQAILALALLHAQDSVYARVDAFVSFLTVLCLLFAAKTLREPRACYRVSLAVSVGVAIAAKYNAVGLLCFPAFVELSQWRGSSPSRNLLRSGCSIALVVSGFLLATPEVLVHPAPLFQGIVYEAIHYSQGHRPHEAFDWYDNNLFYWARYLSLLGLGLVATLLGLVFVLDGLVYRRHSSQRMLLCSYLIVGGLLILASRVRFERNLENFLAPLTVAAAAVAVDLLRTIRQRTSCYAWGFSTALLLAALLLQPVQTLLRFREATRAEASVFARVDVRASSIYWLSAPYPGTPEDLANEPKMIFLDHGDKFSAAQFAVYKSFLRDHEIEYVRARWFEYGYPFSTVNVYHGPSQIIVVKRKPTRTTRAPRSATLSLTSADHTRTQNSAERRTFMTARRSTLEVARQVSKTS